MDASCDKSSYRKWAKLTGKQQRNYKKEPYVRLEHFLDDEDSTELFISNEGVFVRSLKPGKVCLKWGESDKSLIHQPFKISSS